MTKKQLEKLKESRWHRWVHQDAYREHFPELTKGYVERFEGQKAETIPGQAFPVRTILEAHAQGLSIASYNDGVYMDGDEDGIDFEKFQRLDIIDQMSMSEKSYKAIQAINSMSDEQTRQAEINEAVEAGINDRLDAAKNDASQGGVQDVSTQSTKGSNT